MSQWFYNPKLNRWYHPFSYSSDNGPHDRPPEPSGPRPRAAHTHDTVAVDLIGNADGCKGCGEKSKAKRESRPVPVDYPGAE